MDILKKTSNYKKKGPYIYVAVRRVLAVSPIKKKKKKKNH